MRKFCIHNISGLSEDELVTRFKDVKQMVGSWIYNYIIEGCDPNGKGTIEKYRPQTRDGA